MKVDIYDKKMLETWIHDKHYPHPTFEDNRPKVLHIRNTANVACQIRSNSENFRHTVFEIHNPVANWHSDYRYCIDDSYSKLDKALWLMNLLAVARKHDIIHIHGGIGNFGRYIKKFLRKKIICHYHGSDLRLGIVDIAKERRLADAMIVSTPDLLNYCPEATYIPNPYAPKGTSSNAKGEKLIHSHTAEKDNKGTLTIKRVFQKLKRDMGIDYELIHGLSYQEATQRYLTATIAVDELPGGWYGMFALECVGMGIPVLTSIFREYEDLAGFGTPFIKVDRENLESKLRDLLSSTKEDRRDLTKKQMEWMEKIHSPDVTIPRFEKIYREALNG